MESSCQNPGWNSVTSCYLQVMTLCPDCSLYLQMYSCHANASINCCLEGDETTFKTFEKNYASKIQGYSIEKSNCSSKIQDWLKFWNAACSNFVLFFANKAVISSFDNSWKICSSFVSFEISLFFATFCQILMEFVEIGSLFLHSTVCCYLPIFALLMFWGLELIFLSLNHTHIEICEKLFQFQKPGDGWVC